MQCDAIQCNAMHSVRYNLTALKSWQACIPLSSSICRYCCTRHWKKGFAFKYIVLCCSFCPRQIPSACSLLVHIAPYALQFSLRLFYEHLCTVLVQCAWLKMHSHVLRISLRFVFQQKWAKNDKMHTVCILDEKYTWVHQKASTNTHFLTAGALTECVQHNLSLAK